MNRRSFLRNITAASAAVMLPVVGGCGRQTRPNFVFFLIDDLGWKDLGCYGTKFYETPNIDKLAAQGMRFTEAYAACPVCSPTRASIMSGKYPARTNTTDWFGAPQPGTAHQHWTRHKPLLPAPYEEKMALEEVTIAETLKQNGYATFFAGKWHMGGEGFLPEDQGFDINKGGHHRGSPPGGYFSPFKNPKLEDGPEGRHLPARLADETVAFIKAKQSEPFLAYLSFYSVHTPLQSPPDLTEKYQQKAERLPDEGPVWGREGERKVRLVQNHAVYAGMIEAMDAAIGKVLDALESAGVAEQTIIFFMSDNGGLSTSEGHPTSNVPLRAGKGWLYEGGIREPMIVKWPGVVRQGSTCEEPVISMDFYPTMLEMASIPFLPRQHMDGKSMVPLLEGTSTAEKRPLFWHYPHYGNQGGTPGAAVRLGDWKLIEFFEDGGVELYNLKQDVGEQNNLAETEPGKVLELVKLLHEWQQQVGARFPSKNPAAGDP